MREKFTMVILSLCMLTYYAIAQQHSHSLEASINQAIAGSLQKITFTYIVGDEKISQGGGLRFEYPVAYGD